MAEMITWCISKRAIFKWLQILCCLIAGLFLMDGRAQWKPYNVIFATDIFLAVITIITLVIYFVQIHKKNQQLWVKIEIAFNVIAALFSLIFTILLIYDYIKMENNQFGHHRYTAPLNIGNTGWRNRTRIVAVSQLFQTIFYLASLGWAHRYGLN